MLLLVSSASFILLLSLGQLNHFLSIGGIQPNLVLVLLVVYSSFEKDWLRRISLALLATLLLSFEPFFGLQTLFIGTVFTLSAFLVDQLRWQPVINAALTIVICTLLFNLDFFQIRAFLLESVYNLSVGIFIGLIVSLIASRSSIFKNA